MSIARLPLLLSCLVLAAACAPPDGGSDSTAVQEEASARLSPRSASAGVPRVVEIWGENTDWTASDIRVDFGQGVEATVVTANSSFHLTVQLLVAEQAALGPRDVRISWADRTVLLRDAFVIEPGSIAISPGHAALGETVAVEISGWRTNFQAAYTTLSLGPEIELVARV